VMRTIEPKDRVPWPRILALLTSISQKASFISSGWTHGGDHGTEASDARGSTGLYGPLLQVTVGLEVLWLAHDWA
jgi:hypothetical protein